MILYFYDIRAKVKDYNTLKRRFYYHLARTQLLKKSWRTKSVLLVEDKMELEADAFFKKWKPAIICYKAKTDDLVEI